MYSLVESVIVNSAMPNKYQMKLVSKQVFEKEAEDNKYAQYNGFVSTRKNTTKQSSSFNEITNTSDEVSIHKVAQTERVTKNTSYEQKTSKAKDQQKN